ncbi:Zinc finger protein 550 [Eumeta japonica]|uniref:Zinc finger protein 550 n=1 Tax=Eumeta variegata TaxID=151549 RepID=A0A4C1TGG3_EUMVA|nr:Zinc finger protein 550 [Eumeta japonica]
MVEEPDNLLEEMILPTLHTDVSFQPNKTVRTRIKILNRDVNPYFCIYCRTSYNTYDDFALHNENVHNIYQYWCNICQTMFKDMSALEKHFGLNHMKYEDSPYASAAKGNADRVFRKFSKKAIKKEMDDHFVCRYCSEIFEKLGDFMTHLDTHDTENGDSRKKRRKAKLTIKCDVKSFICKYCSESFATVAEFTTHLKIHPSECSEAKKHVCPICYKTFSRNQHLTRHTETVHMNVVVKCPFCSIYIKRKDHLLRHVREVHNTYGRIKTN